MYMLLIFTKLAICLVDFGRLFVFSEFSEDCSPATLLQKKTAVFVEKISW